MTLNLADLFATAIKKEMVISHFDGTVFGVKTSKLPGEWTSQIEDEYGVGKSARIREIKEIWCGRNFCITR